MCVNWLTFSLVLSGKRGLISRYNIFMIGSFVYAVLFDVDVVNLNKIRGHLNPCGK
jgi:hypothetical protein